MERGGGHRKGKKLTNLKNTYNIFEEKRFFNSFNSKFHNYLTVLFKVNYKNKY